ncbi:hypothetical protein [Flavobacterium crassostreae]|nr:hypothetical protein [Flavobacterium crassostreae]
MKKKKVIVDFAFTILAAVLLIFLSEFRWIEKYVGLALIPILIAYYFGQFVERKTRIK